MKFSIGQKVVALTNPSDEYCQQRIKGKIYTVLDVSYCCKCGLQSINITTDDSHPYGLKWAGIVKCDCGSRRPDNNKPWTDSHNFAPLDNLEQTLAEKAESEDYETCALLRDIINQQFQEK